MYQWPDTAGVVIFDLIALREFVVVTKRALDKRALLDDYQARQEAMSKGER